MGSVVVVVAVALWDWKGQGPWFYLGSRGGFVRIPRCEMVQAACINDKVAGPSGLSLKLSTTNVKAGNVVLRAGVSVAARSGKHKLEVFVTTTEQCDPNVQWYVDRGNQAARMWQRGAGAGGGVTTVTVQRARRIDRGRRALDPFHTTWRSSSWRLRSVDIVVTPSLWEMTTRCPRTGSCPSFVRGLVQSAALLSLSRAFVTAYGRSGDGGVWWQGRALSSKIDERRCQVRCGSTSFGQPKVTKATEGSAPGRRTSAPTQMYPSPRRVDSCVDRRGGYGCRQLE